jgi:hypothetical protein
MSKTNIKMQPQTLIATDSTEIKPKSSKGTWFQGHSEEVSLTLNNTREGCTNHNCLGLC